LNAECIGIDDAAISIQLNFDTKRRVPTVNAAPYDILKKDGLGNQIWVEAVEDLRKASARIKELALHSPGEYFVFNQQTREFVTVLTVSPT